MTIKLYTEWCDPGKTGIIRPSHSWVKGMAQAYSGILSDVDVTGVIDTSNASFTLDTGNVSQLPFDVSAAVGDTTHGLLVGTGTTAVTKTDHTIETIIADGNSSGQLEYGAQVISAATAVSGGYRVTLSRQFDNDSGGTVTVEECGVVVACIDSGANAKKLLIIHDLQTQAITNGTSKIFKYHLDFLV